MCGWGGVGEGEVGGGVGVGVLVVTENGVFISYLDRQIN